MAILYSRFNSSHNTCSQNIIFARNIIRGIIISCLGRAKVPDKVLLRVPPADIKSFGICLWSRVLANKWMSSANGQMPWPRSWRRWFGDVKTWRYMIADRRRLLRDRERDSQNFSRLPAHPHTKGIFDQLKCIVGIKLCMGRWLHVLMRHFEPGFGGICDLKGKAWRWDVHCFCAMRMHHNGCTQHW